jgi:hypothetical protein
MMPDCNEQQRGGPAFRSWVIVVAAVVGIVAYLSVLYADRKNAAQAAIQIAAVVVGVVIALAPRVRQAVGRAIDRVRSPGERTRAWTTLGIWVGSAIFFIAVADSDGRLSGSPIHDELMFRTQITFLSHGRLWMPAHPLADFFETFHILVKPVYAPISFPGTSLLYVPGYWLGIPLWIVSAGIAGGVVAMIYRIGAELLDGSVGLLAALLAVCSHWTGNHSALVLPYLPALLLELGTFWAFLHWKRSKATGWALCMGALAGWAAITRPVDALCFLIPIGIALLIELSRGNRRVWIVTILTSSCAVAPFLALQLAFDRGVTGHLLQTPFAYYLQRKLPGLEFSLRREFDLKRRPDSNLPQLQSYYSGWIVPMLRTNHELPLLTLWFRWRSDFATGPIPVPVLVVLIPLGFVYLAKRRGWVILATLPLFLVLYSFYGVFISSYLMALMPLGLLAIAASTLTVGRFGGALAAAICVAALSGLPIARGDVPFAATNRQLPAIDRLLDLHVRQPAIVLFRYAPGADAFQEPVYNPTVLSPDDAAIIRAHDLGSRDGELLKYYEKISPEREVYRFDRGTEDLVDLGSVQSLVDGGWNGN